jgi:hypothetical protein
MFDLPVMRSASFEEAGQLNARLAARSDGLVSNQNISIL